MIISVVLPITGWKLIQITSLKLQNGSTLLQVSRKNSTTIRSEWNISSSKCVDVFDKLYTRLVCYYCSSISIRACLKFLFLKTIRAKHNMILGNTRYGIEFVLATVFFKSSFNISLQSAFLSLNRCAYSSNSMCWIKLFDRYNSRRFWCLYMGKSIN